MWSRSVVGFLAGSAKPQRPLWFRLFLTNGANGRRASDYLAQHGNESLLLRIRGRANWQIGFLRCFRLASFEFSLAKIGRFRRIGSNGQISFLDEVAPALVIAGRTLRLLKLFQGGFCLLLAAHDRHHSTRPISSDVVQDDHVGSAGVFACQKESIRSLLKS